MRDSERQGETGKDREREIGDKMKNRGRYCNSDLERYSKRIRERNGRKSETEREN